MKIILLLLINTTFLGGQYFQQKVNYNIEVDLDINQDMFDVSCIIDYYNNSPTSLDTIYFHLWANAFSSKKSAFAQQMVRMQNLQFHFANMEEMGGYEELKYSGKGSFELDKKNPDIGYIVLAAPLLPGDNQLLEFKYTLSIPFQFSRMGKNRQGDIHLVHWFPKPAVYDEMGWHWFPYLSMGEFYSEYGTYSVSINRNEEYEVGSTGIRLEMVSDNRDHYFAENVFDFALFYIKDGNTTIKNYRSTSGRNVELKVINTNQDPLWKKYAMQFLAESVEFYEKEIGPYTYPQLTLVNGNKPGNSGMEYPMVIEVSALTKDHLRYYINHEVGHQWFYSQLGFNEREEAYLDEGLTTFYEHKYTKNLIGSEHHTAQFSPWPRKALEMPLLQYMYVAQKRRGFSESPSEDPQQTSLINFGLNAYERAAYAYRFLEAYLGPETFQAGLQSFYKKWNGKHPSGRKLIEELMLMTGRDLTWFQKLISTDVTVDLALEKSNEELIITNKGNVEVPAMIFSSDTTFWIDPISIGSSQKIEIDSDEISVNGDFLGLEGNSENNHLNAPKPTLILGLNLDHSKKKEIYYLPALRYNYADGLGMGLSIYNSSLVTKKLQYLIDPQYGLTSKRVIGNAWLAYNHFPIDSRFRKIQSKLSLKRYSDFYSDNLDFRTDYIRLSPQISLHFKNDPSSLTYQKITFQSIHLRTEELVFANENNFEINGNWGHFIKARYDYFNFKAINRVEYWTELEFHNYKDPFDNSQQYLKLTAAFNYKTPYALGRNLILRIFGSGFIANSQRNSPSFNSILSKGSIALLSQSANDYTRNQYFLTRQNAGSFINQIGTGGGGFKDAFGSAYNIGMSNDWAIAANFNIDLPVKFPVFFKLKPYFDIGYYRTKSTSSELLRGQTLMSGGLMLTYLDGGIEVYFPLIANDPINNLYKIENENIFKKISFKIDLHRLNPWDMIDDLNL
jgi:hypothetical protein